MTDVGQNQFAVMLNQLSARLSDEIHLQFEVLSVQDKTVRGSIQFVFTADHVTPVTLPEGTAYAVFSTNVDQCTAGIALSLALAYDQVNNHITLKSKKNEVDMITEGKKVEHDLQLLERTT